MLFDKKCVRIGYGELLYYDVVNHRFYPLSPFRGECALCIVESHPRAARVCGAPPLPHTALPPVAGAAPHTALPSVAGAGLLGCSPFGTHPNKTKLISKIASKRLNLSNPRLNAVQSGERKARPTTIAPREHLAPKHGVLHGAKGRCSM